MSTLTPIQVWREGIAPELSLAGLEALAAALVADRPELIEGATTQPAAPLTKCERALEPCTGACPVAYALWQGEGLANVGQVEDRFGALADELNRLWPFVPLRQRPPVSVFAGWWDSEAPRDERRRVLLAAVEDEIALRKGA